MKILILNSLYYPHIGGGAEKSTQLLSEGLKSKGYHPVIVTTSYKNEINYVNGIKVYYFKVPNLYWMYDAKKQPAYKKPFWHFIDSYNPFIKVSISQIIEREKPSLIHTNTLAGLSVMAWKVTHKYNLPLVHTTRDHYLLCPRSTMFNNDKNCIHQCWDCRLLSIVKKKLSTNVDAVIGVSRYILNKHLQYGYFNSSKIKTYIYNPVNYALTPRQQQSNNNKITFGYVGLLSFNKGIEYFLKRFFGMNLKNAQLLIYGKGITSAYEKELKNRYQKENIMFMGFKKSEEIYPQLDVIVFPSLLNEAFGRIVPEANSFGIPVIVSNRGGLPEIVKEGFNGFIFDPDKKGDLENKIELFINNKELLSNLSKNCLKTVEEYSIEKVVGKYIDVYLQLVK